MPKDTYIPNLLKLFRQHGYDGATLSRISEATGLGKASLYHHFPGGKDEMVEAVLDYLDRWVADNILPALQSQGDALTRFARMCDRLSELYEEGQQPCMSAILLLGSTRDVFHDRVEATYRAWIEAMAKVLMEVGFERELAQERGEEAVIAVQGSLILSHGLNDSNPFKRTMQQLPQRLCRDR
ncbi:TetR/AcrR family transcriptional regulator [Pseudanabaena sp. PCC 6802]|uniref:TetR/AcrR family transcriptional regulator n=1 Tax=Pseudanabaena sp. PCC 6802 TaxID=118173 RepID=UPI00034ADD4B|nr:TetR/AcrR family transcriptional regulator [Pseudanabaena sp. PCC 6802]